jgi:hypothetical protein
MTKGAVIIVGKGYGFACSVRELLRSDTNTIVGHLATHAAARSLGAIEDKQIHVWTQTIEWIKGALEDCLKSNKEIHAWTVCFEYEIPRRGGRIDAVLLADRFILVIEFKAGKADKNSRRQVEDYGLELIDFHAASHNKLIFPMVCSGTVSRIEQDEEHQLSDGVQKVRVTNFRSLSRTIIEVKNCVDSYSAEAIEHSQWLKAPYEPTPTIVEAARALYSGHDVIEISLSQASAQHLEKTEKAVAEIVKISNTEGKKAICFITGVPGAGKTLAGLNIVHSMKNSAQCTFLSGNGPLVKVLQAVLAQDFKKNQKIIHNDLNNAA